MALHFVLDEGADAERLAATTIGEVLHLTGAEAHHAATVRRVRPGEAVTLGDGRGRWASATVRTAQPRAVELEITGVRDEPEPAPRLMLVQALAKGDRDELAVQAATEIGVDVVIPWQAARSVSRWEGQKLGRGVERWRAIAREAGKQAHRAWLPEIAAPCATAGLARAVGSASVIVLEPSATTALTGVLAAHEPGRDIALVVGPEGGIAPEELRVLTDAGATLARLGDTVLRTSTAGPAALALASAAVGRW